jgi:hypothetical protein
MMKNQKLIVIVALVCLVLGASDNAEAEPVLIIEDGSVIQI